MDTSRDRDSLTLYRLLIPFVANSLEPDQTRQIIWPDLDPNCLTLIGILKDFSRKKIIKNTLKNPARTKKREVFPGGGGGGKELTLLES